MEVFGYRRLIAYQKAKEVVKETYKLLKKFPSEEKFAMCSQLRRASISITSNIAEGVNRHSVKDKSHFIEMAYGSLMEVSSQFEIAEDLGYISSDDQLRMDQLIDEVARLYPAYSNHSTSQPTLSSTLPGLNPKPKTPNSKPKTNNFKL